MKVKLLSGARLLATPWTGAYQAPPPMGFSRQEYWSGVPLPSPKKKCGDCVDHHKLWEILKDIGIPDHLTCLLRNLYAGQEAAVRTGHATTDWFKIGKGARQGCKLSPCLLNFYAEYITRNAGVEEAQAGIKIARGEISTTSDTQMTPPLWQKVKRN